MYKSLTQYIDCLRQAGELIEVDAPVDPVLEIAEITDRFSKQPGGGKALLFKNTRTEFSVATNLMGSQRRMAMALGVDRPEALRDRLDAIFGQVMGSHSGNFSELLKMLPLVKQAGAWLPRSRKGHGECQQVVSAEPNLEKLPILKCWPADGGRFVTLPLVHTRDPETGVRNVGMYRMQLFS
ncbi:MAG: UbiD family decarboxylase, partial [Rikenellaceae bacterium]|nr:UbiD family decarboxylase [Rikenellaceae bacterium]